jgi:tetratricopeptide (TPR) repeat protein
MRLFLVLVSFIVFSQSVYSQADSVAYKKAQAEYDKGDFKNSLKSVDQALSIAEKEDYFLLKAMILNGLKNYQGVFDTYSRAINVLPESFFAHCNMGIFLTEIGELEFATEILTKAIDLAGNNQEHLSTAYTNRSGVFTSVRDFESAYEDLIKAVQYDSTNVAPLINLGAVCDEIGKADEGIKFLLKALELDPSYYPIYGNIGFMYQTQGQYEKAIECYNKVIEMNKDEPLGYSNRSFNRMKLGDFKGAMTDIDKSIKLYPQNSYAYMVKGSIYLEMGKADKACEQFSIALLKGFTERYGKDVESLMQKNCPR